jgi:hypothetical protein
MIANGSSASAIAQKNTGQLGSATTFEGHHHNDKSSDGDMSGGLNFNRADTISATASDELQPEGLIQVELESLQIDLQQPRQYFPNDLRVKVAQGQLMPQEAITELMARTANGDEEALGYVANIRDLAKSIGDVQLQYPLIVRREGEGNSITYPIIDGERRYWAIWYLRGLSDVQSLGVWIPETIPVIVTTVAFTAPEDDIKRIQWAVNLHREDVPPIDTAEAIWSIRESFIARLKLDPTLAGEIPQTQSQALSLMDTANELTQREMERLTGRPISRAHLYRMLTVGEKLGHPARVLARAHGVSLNKLKGVAILPLDKQVEQLRHLIAIERGFPQMKSVRDKTDGPGRPTVFQRNMNLCDSLVEGLRRLDDTRLAKATPEDMQTLLAQLDQTATELKRIMQVVQKRLKRA